MDALVPRFSLPTTVLTESWLRHISQSIDYAREAEAAAALARAECHRINARTVVKKAAQSLESGNQRLRRLLGESVDLVILCGREASLGDAHDRVVCHDVFSCS